MVLMGMWLQSFTIMPVQVGVFTNIGEGIRLNDVIRSWLGLQTPMKASHIHIICIQSVLEPSDAVDGHVNAPLCSYACAGGNEFYKHW